MTNLNEQADSAIWFKFNLLLQAVDELTAEHGKAGDATRQLTVLSKEACRRGIFAYKIGEDEVSDDALWTWYEVLKQLIEGWPDTKGVIQQYGAVINELKSRGHKMPVQSANMHTLIMGSRWR